MANKKMLSLCMVTKNDENYLLSSLQNIAGIVDEMIIVDIGSSDRTVEIAKQAGVNVYEMKWNNSYSEAKNLCLNKAEGRWVLFLQANETIDAQQQKEIPSLIRNPNVEGYLLYVEPPSEQNFLISSPVQSLRLFRKREDYRFQYRAFARIPEGVLTNVKDAGIRISQQKSLGPSGENDSLSQLLQEDLKENSNVSYLFYLYGIELLNKQRYEESKDCFQKALHHISSDYLFAPHLYKCLSWVYLFQSKQEDALIVLKEGISLFPFYTDLAVLRAEIWKQKYNYIEAIHDLEQCIKISEQHLLIVPMPEIHISIILEMLGEIHEQLFNFEQSLDYYLKAFTLNENNQELLSKIGELANLLGDIDIIENLLKEAIELKNGEQLLILMESLFQAREYSKVLESINFIETMTGNKDQSLVIKYICQMMLGNAKKAKHDIEDVNKNSPFYHYVLLQRIEMDWLHHKWVEVESLLIEMDQLETIDAQIKIMYHSLHRLLTGKERDITQIKVQDFEMVLTLAGSFLWMNQDDKAKLLLPLLITGMKEEQYSRLAELWVKRNDYETIERIFQSISKYQTKLEFKKKVITQLLRYDHIESAQKLAKAGDYQPLGALEHVLWASSHMNKLKQLKAYTKTKINHGAPNSITKQLSKPSKELLAFYHTLVEVKNICNGTTLKDIKEDITCAKIHEEIGGIFEAEQKKTEAYCAFLRALQWDPLSEVVQEKIKQIYNNAPNDFHAYLVGQDWILEGDVFLYKECFINFVIGRIHFQNNRHEEALTYFYKIKQEVTNFHFIQAYIISSLWIMGEERLEEKWYEDKSITTEVFSSFFLICQRALLGQFEDVHHEYLYSELIKKEKEKIKSYKFE
jgi:tetratricopeptide (TPR) repeat protein